MHAIPHPLDRRALLLAALCLCPLTVSAQQGARIWRCGNQYSDKPCLNGAEIAPADAPPEGARAEADAATRRAQAQANQMARERERLEAAAAGRPPAVIARTSPWETQEDEDGAQTTRLKRPKTQKGRKPKSEHFTAKGDSSSQRRGR